MGFSDLSPKRALQQKSYGASVATISFSDLSPKRALQHFTYKYQFVY